MIAVEGHMDLDKAGEALHVKILGDKIPGDALNPCRDAVVAEIGEAEDGVDAKHEEEEEKVRHPVSLRQHLRESILCTQRRGQGSIILKLVGPKSPVHLQRRSYPMGVSGSFAV